MGSDSNRFEFNGRRRKRKSMLMLVNADRTAATAVKLFSNFFRREGMVNRVQL